MTNYKVTSHDGVELNVQAYGDSSNPALIFSNSLGTNLSMWQPQVEALKSKFFIICYDTRGHGDSSSTGSNRWAIDDLGQDVVTILDFLNVDKASFCGISMGGMTGQWLGINAPDRFNKIVVSNTAARIGNKEAWDTRAEQVREQGLSDLADSTPGRWFSTDFINSNPAVVNSFIAKMKAGSAEGYARCCEALADADLREDVSKITVPTLVVGGELDPVTTVDDAKWLGDKIGTNAVIKTISASHIANIESADGFTQLVKQFLLD